MGYAMAQELGLRQRLVPAARLASIPSMA
jgi:hypothetical protein